MVQSAICRDMSSMDTVLLLCFAVAWMTKGGMASVVW